MRTMIVAFVIAFLFLIPSFAAEPDRNLTLNPGFEETTGTFAAQWTPLTMGPTASFEIDRTEKHGGSQSVRIVATENTRTYICSDYIPVAPGETISASAWVRCKDVPEGKGTTILIGEFTDSKEKNPSVAKFGVAKVSDESWQKIEGKMKVPDAATRMRLRMGFSYSLGTIWWDDVVVHAEQPLVAAIAIDGATLSPGLGAVPIDILNRAGLRGKREMRVGLGAAMKTQVVSLTGEPVQRVTLPLEMSKRGKQNLKASLIDLNGEQVIFAEEREVTIPAPLVLQPAVPTHWAVEDGAPKLEGEIALALSATQRDGAALTVRLVDADNQVRANWSFEKSKPIPDGYVSYQINAPKLPIGEYKLVTDLKMRSGQAYTSQQPWAVIPRALAKTTLNADGFPVINGKAIFPIGIFNGGKFKDQAAAGFTITHAYNAMRVIPGKHPDDLNAQQFLDGTYANGMHMCCMVPLDFAYSGEWNLFRRRIRMFRNHPGLLCWDEEESLARGTTTMETLAKMRQIVQEEDPNHPFMVGDARDSIDRVKDRSNFFPLKYMDLGMWWWYPIPLQARATTDALEGQESAPGDQMAPPSFLVQRNTEKPLWVGLQAYRYNDKARYPNAVEYRAQPYIAMIHGAKGLMWYGGSVTNGAYVHPEESNLDDLKKVVKEMNEMSAVMMSPTGETPKFAPADAPLSVMLKKAKDGAMLMVVNRGSKAMEVVLDVTQHSGSAKVLRENRSVSVSDGKLKDKFEPYAVHVYSLLK